jgi:hypothetical protein
MVPEQIMARLLNLESTLHARAHGRRSEEKAVVKFLLHMTNLGQPVRIKFLCVSTRVNRRGILSLPLMADI